MEKFEILRGNFPNLKVADLTWSKQQKYDMTRIKNFEPDPSL